MRKLIEKYSRKPENLFGILFVNFLFGYLPFALILGILTLFGVIPINFNGEETYGIEGLLVVIAFIPFVVFMLSFFTWLYFIIGNFFLNLFKKIF